MVQYRVLSNSGLTLAAPAWSNKKRPIKLVVWVSPDQRRSRQWTLNSWDMNVDAEMAIYSDAGSNPAISIYNLFKSVDRYLKYQYINTFLFPSADVRRYKKKETADNLSNKHSQSGMLVLFISKTSKQLAVFQLLRGFAKLAITLFNSHNQLISINVFNQLFIDRQIRRQWLWWHQPQRHRHFAVLDHPQSPVES